MSKVYIVLRKEPGADAYRPDDYAWSKKADADKRAEEIKLTTSFAHVESVLLDTPPSDYARQFWACSVDTRTGAVEHETTGYEMQERRNKSYPATSAGPKVARAISHQSADDARALCESARLHWLEHNGGKG